MRLLQSFNDTLPVATQTTTTDNNHRSCADNLSPLDYGIATHNTINNTTNNTINSTTNNTANNTTNNTTNNT